MAWTPWSRLQKTAPSFSQSFFTQEDSIPFDASASERDIYNCFRLILGRNPSHEEWAGHRSHAGLPLASVAAQYVDSTEYQNLREKNRKPELAQLPGFVMFASQEDLAVGKHILTGSIWEPHVTQVFTQRVSEGMTVVDIGANIGYFTFLAAARVGPSGRVWAIEPNRRNVAFLLAARERNGFRHVEIVQAAASDRWQVLSLSTDCSNGAVKQTKGSEPADFAEPVMALPLDTVLSQADRIDVVKIDVEGAEARALTGMRELLDRHRPVIFSEFTPSAIPAMSGISPGEYLDMFTSRGYALAVLEGSGARFTNAAALLEQADAMAADDHLDILAEPVQRAGS